MISYDHFAELDLRVAKVLSAEKVSNSDKLLKLIVKLGSEERTIVAGIAATYLPEEMTGKSIIIIANLEPRKLRGVESQGMLLAADGAQGPILLTTDKSVDDGAKVK